MHRTAPRRRVGWRPEPAPATELSALLSLPQDCLMAVLAALPPRALANACGASRALRQATSDPKLWAPHCRDQWPEDEDQSPSRFQYGRRSRLFAGLTVCGTHLAPHAKLVAEAAVGAMGGRWEGDLTTAATHLLCGAAFSAKSRGAASNMYATQGSNPRLASRPQAGLLLTRASLASDSRTRLVTPEWLWATVREARRQPEPAYRPPLLHGAVISISGLPHHLKAKVEEVERRVESTPDTWHAAACACACMGMCVCICMCAFAYAYVHVPVPVHGHGHVHVHVRVHVHVQLWPAGTAQAAGEAEAGRSVGQPLA